MFQINLIPDLKAEYLKAQRTKNTVMTIAFVVTAVFIVLTIIMFVQVNFTQKNHTNNLNEDVQRLAAEYSAVEDLDKVITVQKQLEALPALHGEKPLVSRLPQYLSIVIPEGVEITSFDMSLGSDENDETIITMNGTADTPILVNVLTDTLKNASFQAEADEESYRPFPSVVLETVTNSDDDGTIFEILFSFDPRLFTDHGDITLTVPQGDFTLSERESPNLDTSRESDLFDTAAPEEGEQ